MIRALVPTSALLAGCVTFSDFDVPRAVPEQMVIGSPMPVPLPAAFPLALSLDLSEALAQYPRTSQVEVRLTSFTLAVTPTARPAGDVDDFAFVDTLRVYATGSTLPRIELAHALAHGASSTLEFGVAAELDLAPYIREHAQVDAEGTGTLPADDVSFDGRVVFRVHPMM